MRYSEEVYRKVFPAQPEPEVVESAVEQFPKADTNKAEVADQEGIEVDGGEDDGDTGSSESADE